MTGGFRYILGNLRIETGTGLPRQPLLSLQGILLQEVHVPGGLMDGGANPRISESLLWFGIPSGYLT